MQLVSQEDYRTRTLKKAQAIVNDHSPPLSSFTCYRISLSVCRAAIGQLNNFKYDCICCLFLSMFYCWLVPQTAPWGYKNFTLILTLNLIQPKILREAKSNWGSKFV